MADFLTRLRTFYTIKRIGNRKMYVVKFPNKDVKLRELALAGFIFEGDLDTVRCSFCKVRFFNWTASDVPFQLHKEAMPNCPFVKTVTQQGINRGDYIDKK